MHSLELGLIQNRLCNIEMHLHQQRTGVQVYSSPIQHTMHPTYTDLHYPQQYFQVPHLNTYYHIHPLPNQLPPHQGIGRVVGGYSIMHNSSQHPGYRSQIPRQYPEHPIFYGMHNTNTTFNPYQFQTGLAHVHTLHQLAEQGTSQLATAMWHQQNGLHAVHGLGHDGMNMSHSGNRHTRSPGLS